MSSTRKHLTSYPVYPGKIRKVGGVICLIRVPFLSCFILLLSNFSALLTITLLAVLPFVCYENGLDVLWIMFLGTLCVRVNRSNVGKISTGKKWPISWQKPLFTNCCKLRILKARIFYIVYNVVQLRWRFFRIPACSNFASWQRWSECCDAL